MKAAALTLLPAALLPLPVSASATDRDWQPPQGAGLLMDAPQAPPSAPTTAGAPTNEAAAEGTTPPVISPSESQPATFGDETVQISPVEQHLAKGIALLLKLEQVMASVDSPETAQKAIQPVGLITAELGKWPQGFLTLPPLNEEQRLEYEDRYLPVIRRINKRIKMQGERLASAQYYGCRPLAASLVRLVLTLQQ